MANVNTATKTVVDNTIATAVEYYNVKTTTTASATITPANAATDVPLDGTITVAFEEEVFGAEANL